MTIGIFTAVVTEALSFLDSGAVKLSGDGAFSVYQLKLGRYDAVLCCPPSVGEIAAASACQLLITKYNADVILNFGVVGALTDKTSLFSTVFVGDVVHYDMDTSEIDPLPVGRYECFDDVAVECDKALLKKALSVCNIPVVRCASADKFVSDAAKKTALNANYGAKVCDMESAGILFTCKFNNIPCLMVKCISDSLIGGADEYEQNCVKAAQNFMELATEICVGL